MPGVVAALPLVSVVHMPLRNHSLIWFHENLNSVLTSNYNLLPGHSLASLKVKNPKFAKQKLSSVDSRV